MRLGLPLCLCLCLALPAWAQAPSAAEAQRIVDRLGSLGLPDLRRKPLVELGDGRVGFLLQTTPDDLMLLSLRPPSLAPCRLPTRAVRAVRDVPLLPWLRRRPKSLDEALVLAWAARRNGQDAYVSWLLCRALERVSSGQALNPTVGASLLTQHMGWQLLRAAEADLRRAPRPLLLARFERIARRFPNVRSAAQSFVQPLRRMVREDEPGRRPPPTPPIPLQRTLSTLAPAVPIADLVHQLRDARRDDAGPAAQLERWGLASAPSLLALWNDDRLTRIPCSPNHYPTVRRYRDVARRLLARLAAGPLPNLAAARAWWKAHQAGRAFELQLRALREGWGGDASRARRLLALDEARAERALAPLVSSLRSHRGLAILEVLAAKPTLRRAACLRQALRAAGTRHRLTAARGLARLGSTVWVPAMLKLALGRPETSDHLDALQLLLERGGVAAGKALARRWTTLDGELRDRVLRIATPVWTLSRKPPPACKQLLTSLLSETEPTVEFWGQLGSDHLLEVGDIAAHLLVGADGFDTGQGVHHRRRARGRLRNRLRAKRWRKPLPLPALPAVPSLSPVRAARLTQALRSATTVAQVTSTLRAFRRAGLAGVAPLRRVQARIPRQHPAWARAKRLVAELSRTLRAVHIDPSTRALLTPAAGEILEACQGRPLTAKLLEVWVRRALSERAPALLLRIDLDPESGLTVEVRLPHAREGRAWAWATPLFEPQARLTEALRGAPPATWVFLARRR